MTWFSRVVTFPRRSLTAPWAAAVAFRESPRSRLAFTSCCRRLSVSLAVWSSATCTREVADCSASFWQRAVMSLSSTGSTR